MAIQDDPESTCFAFDEQEIPTVGGEPLIYVTPSPAMVDWFTGWYIDRCGSIYDNPGLFYASWRRFIDGEIVEVRG